MPGRNDIQGSAGIDLKDFEIAISVMTQRLDALEAVGNKANEGIKDIGQTSEKTAASLGAFGKVLSSLGLSLSIAGVVAFGKSLLGFGKEISDAAQESDLSTVAFQRTKGALMNFVGATDAGAAIHTVAQALREVRQHSNPQVISQFDALGISFAKLADPVTNAKTLLEDLATNYEKAADKSEYLARLSSVFGDDVARKLVPAFAAGGHALKAFGDATTVAGSDLTDAAKQGELAWERLGVSVKNTSLEIIGDIVGFEKAIKKYKDDANKPDETGMYDVKKHPELSHIRQISLSPEDSFKYAAPKGMLDDTGDFSSFLEKNGMTDTDFRRRAGLIPLVTNSPLKMTSSATPQLDSITKVSNSPLDPNQATKEAAAADNLFKIQIDLNQAIAKRTPALQSQLDILKAQSDAVDRELKLPVTQRDKIRTSELQAQANQINLTTSNLTFQYDLEQQRSSFETRALTFQIEGQTNLANIEKIKAEYAQRIAVAQRDGKDYLVDQLKTQQSLALIQQESIWYSMSPAQRAQYRETERRQHRAGIRAQEAIDEQKAHGGYFARYGAYARESSRGDVKFPSTGRTVPSAFSITATSITTGTINATSVAPK